MKVKASEKSVKKLRLVYLIEEKFTSILNAVLLLFYSYKFQNIDWKSIEIIKKQKEKEE